MPQVIVFAVDGLTQAITVPQSATATEIAAASCGGAPYTVVETSALPDRLFQGAWNADLSIDMAKARDIWRDILRSERASRWAALDALSLRALEDGDAAGLAAVKAKKQALRDITKHAAIAAAGDLSALQAVKLPPSSI